MLCLRPSGTTAVSVASETVLFSLPQGFMILGAQWKAFIPKDTHLEALGELHCCARAVTGL